MKSENKHAASDPVKINNNAKTRASRRVRDMTYTAFFTVFIILCSWINVPLTVSFTMQTFGIYTTLYLLGAARGTLSVVIYMALGLLGLPVFAGFNSGASALFGSTGGYIFGFLLICAVYGLVTRIAGRKKAAVIAAFVIGTVLCYAFGTLWFVFIYTKNGASISFIKAFSICVAPFIIPDVLKMLLSVRLGSGIARFIT